MNKETSHDGKFDAARNDSVGLQLLEALCLNGGMPLPRNPIITKFCIAHMEEAALKVAVLLEIDSELTMKEVKK